MEKFVFEKIDVALSDELLTELDKAYISGLRSEKRRREVSAWRSLLRKNLDAENQLREIKYAEVGAPYLLDSELYISVSHSSSHVAILISDAACAVDIEQLNRDFARVSRRYATQTECELISANVPILPLIWSAKEAMIKISGESELNLLTQIIVKQIEPTNQTLHGSINSQPVSMKYQIIKNHIVVTASIPSTLHP